MFAPLMCRHAARTAGSSGVYLVRSNCMPLVDSSWSKANFRSGTGWKKTPVNLASRRSGIPRSIYLGTQLVLSLASSGSNSFLVSSSEGHSQRWRVSHASPPQWMHLAYLESVKYLAGAAADHSVKSCTLRSRLCFVVLCWPLRGP